MKKLFIPLLSFFFFVSGCYFIKHPKQVLKPVSFIGKKGKVVVLYAKQKKNGKISFIPLKTLKTGTRIFLKPGHYILANECSFYEFDHSLHKETVVNLGKVVIQPKHLAEPLDGTHFTLLTSCRDPIDQQVHIWTHRTEFDILPGKNSFLVSGQEVSFEFLSDNQFLKKLETYPVSLKIPQEVSQDSFFVLPYSKDVILPQNAPVISSAPLNGAVWLLPGSYMIEVNGSKRLFKIKESAKEQLSFDLGVLHVAEPKNFPMQERLSQGGRPIYVYLDQSVLFDLNTNYSVFPGSYKISLEGTDISKELSVEKGNVKRVQTQGARVLASSCEEVECYSVPGINLFETGKPSPSAKVKVNVPFIVFEQSYSYGVEGVRGVTKPLKTTFSGMVDNYVVRLKMNWEYKESLTKIRTEIVRLESRGGGVAGKSLDLLFSKPAEIYIPTADYTLTYFVVDKNLDKVKMRQDLSLNNHNEVKEFSIPIYYEKQNTSKAPPVQVEEVTEDDSLTLTPIVK